MLIMNGSKRLPSSHKTIDFYLIRIIQNYLAEIV